jgi:hypothetical protein
MAHNGGRFQTQLNFLNAAGMFPFVNKIKTSGDSNRWQYTVAASGRPTISILNVNGYPTTVAGGSLRVIVQDEGLTYRAGKRVLTWNGTQTFTVSGATVDAGQSLSGGHGRAVMVMSDSTSPRNVTVTLTATDGNLTSLCWMHEDDESRYDSEKAAFPNREPFGTKFLEEFADLKLGVMRFLDLQFSNLSNVAKWAHRTPIGYYSYSVSTFPPSLYAGSLAGTNPNFTATLSGFVLADGATVVVDIPGATTASGTTTLNVSDGVGGTGAKSIKLVTGAAWARSSTTTDRRATFTYSAILDAYITFDVEFDEGLLSGVPPEVCIDLCNALQCHGHFIPPSLTCDTPSDYMQEFATYAAANLNSGLQFRCEQGPNETWNTAADFKGTQLAEEYSKARYSGVENINDWYGRSGALIGNLVKTAFGSDRSRYAILCGMQTAQAPDGVSGANTSRRIESTRHVAAGGSPASNFITHVCPASYWTTMNMFADTVGTTPEKYLRFLEVIRQARTWNAGDAAARLAAIEWCFETTAMNAWVDDQMVERLVRWSAVAENYTIFGTAQKFGLTFYEGNYYPGDITANAIHGIDGVTRGNPTVITINNVGGASGHAFVASMTCSFRNLGGITQLNGIAPVTVLSVTDTTVTLDLDSTAFSAFTTGGTGTFAYNGTTAAGIIYSGYGGPITAPGILHNFLYASRFATGSLYATQKVFNLIMTYPNAEFPSDFNTGGGVSQWSKRDDLYSPVSPQWDAMKLFSNRLRRKRLVATP